MPACSGCLQCHAPNWCQKICYAGWKQMRQCEIWKREDWTTHLKVFFQGQRYAALCVNRELHVRMKRGSRENMSISRISRQRRRLEATGAPELGPATLGNLQRSLWIIPAASDMRPVSRRSLLWPALASHYCAYVGGRRLSISHNGRATLITIVIVQP